MADICTTTSITFLGAGLCGVVAMLILFYAAFAYMAAQIFRRPEWEEKAKAELYQLFISILMVSAAIGFALVADAAGNAFAGGCPFDVASGFLNMVINQYALPEFLQLQQIALWSQYFDNLMIRYGPTVWSWVHSYAPGAGAIDKTVQFVLNVMGVFFASVVVQLAGLQIIQGTMYTLVLPAGLLLRFIPATRDAGAFLIVSAVAFYVVFPASFAVHAAVISEIRKDMQDDNFVTEFWDDVRDPNSNNLLTKAGFASAFFTSVNDPRVTPLACLEPKLTPQLIAGCMTVILNEVGFTLMAAFFPATLSMIIATTFIKSTMKFISQKLD
jgi:hypothetical protein